MGRKHGLKCGSIGGKMTDGIEEFGARFTIKCHVTHEEARQWLVLVAQKFLATINSDTKLRPYLKEYPFPASRLKMRICFRNNRHFPYRDGSMESATLEENEVTYFQEPIYIEGR